MEEHLENFGKIIKLLGHVIQSLKLLIISIFTEELLHISDSSNQLGQKCGTLSFKTLH